MVEFDTIRSQRVEFGDRNFLEFSRKRAIDPDYEYDFLSLARGFTTRHGDKVWKANLTLPEDPDVLRFVIESLQAELDELETEEVDV